MTPICDFPPKFFFSSNSQFKSSVAGDNQRTALNPTKVLHAEVCGTFVDSGCVFVFCSNQIELSDQRAGDGRKSMEIGQFRIRIRPDKLHHVLDQGSKMKPHEFHRCWIERPQQQTNEHVILLRVGDKNKCEPKIDPRQK